MLKPSLWVFKHPQANRATIPVLPLKLIPGPRLGFLVYEGGGQRQPWRFHEGNIFAVEDSPGRGIRGGEQLLRELVLAGWLID